MVDASLVRINYDAIHALTADLDSLVLYRSGRPFDLPDGDPAGAIPYLLALSSLQYRFWDGEGEGYRRYCLEGRTGASAMALGFDRAWGESQEPGGGILACCSYEASVQLYFGEIPDPLSRSETLQDVLGSTRLSEVVSKLDGVFRSGAVDVETAQLIAEAFPIAFGDPFLKKAQLALILMVAEYRASGISVEEDLLAFADYQVPSVLRHLGVLVYAPALADLIDSRRLIPPGGVVEHSIRAASVLACEEISKRFGVKPSQVDGWLWRQRMLSSQPFHLTKTNFY